MASGQKPCPYCGESIKLDAIKCRFCGEILDQAAYAQARDMEAAPRAAAPPPSPAQPQYSQSSDGGSLLFEASPSLFTAFGAVFWSVLLIACAVYLAVFPVDILGQYATHKLVTPNICLNTGCMPHWV